MSVPRPHYTAYQGNKRLPPHGHSPRPSAPPPPQQLLLQQQQQQQQQQQIPPPPVVVSSHHEEIVRYVYDAWNRATTDNSDPEYPLSYYQEKGQNPQLKDFKPFDLEAWSERRKLEQSAQRPS